MTEHAVPWSNCVGFSVDNTSMNMGTHNSIISRVLTKNPSCYFMGCLCHIIHNTAHKGAEAFAIVTGFDVEDFCVDLFYYFDKSTKRKGALRSYNEFSCNEKILVYIWSTKKLQSFIKQLMGKFIMLNAIKSAEDLTKVDITKHKDASMQ